LKKTLYISSIGLLLIIGFILFKSGNENYSVRTGTNFDSKTDSLFDNGKVLFKNNCASCHYIGMDKKMTAPALGGITNRRKKKWLYDYTRNSIGMHNSNDSIAIELRNQGWALMSSFPNLSDSEMDEIYYFIEKRYKMSLDGIPVPIDFEFKMSENKRAKACNHIVTEKRDILNVSVSKNRFWKFSCGIENHKQSEFKRTTLKEMFDFDNSINDLTFMTYEFPAKRISKESEWE